MPKPKRKAASKPTAAKPGVKVVAENRTVPYKYHVLERIESGLVLSGGEVKALREGRANLRDAYAVVKGGEAWLLNCHISAYSHSGYVIPEALRTRKLLLHKDQILKLGSRVQEKGLTLVPLRVYFKDGRAKCELALVKGKKVWDRRDEIRRRTDQREIDQELKRYR
ncbi:MAG TPA: SsrA-binding protein SmpB [Candidatus Acidoferrales bacterium]|nr:SsrA-binding protein SmpB [Candidatus Acidoferrales bacterium]